MLVRRGHLEQQTIGEVGQEFLIFLDMLRATFLPGGFLLGCLILCTFLLLGRNEFKQFRFQFYCRIDDTRNRDHQLTTTLTFDTHDHTLTPVKHTTIHTDLIPHLQMDLVRIIIGDLLASLFGEGDKVTHVMFRDGEIILFVRESRFTDEKTIVTEPDGLAHTLKVAT